MDILTSVHLGKLLHSRTCMLHLSAKHHAELNLAIVIAWQNRTHKRTPGGVTPPAQKRDTDRGGGAAWFGQKLQGGGRYRRRGAGAGGVAARPLFSAPQTGGRRRRRPGPPAATAPSNAPKAAPASAACRCSAAVASQNGRFGPSVLTASARPGRHRLDQLTALSTAGTKWAQPGRRGGCGAILSEMRPLPRHVAAKEAPGCPRCLPGGVSLVPICGLHGRHSHERLYERITEADGVRLGRRTSAYRVPRPLGAKRRPYGG